MTIYIAKNDTWFKEGTVVELVEDFSGNGLKMGLFQGTLILDENIMRSKTIYGDKKPGDEVTDREVCGYDEFDEKEV